MTYIEDVVVTSKQDFKYVHLEFYTSISFHINNYLITVEKGY